MGCEFSKSANRNSQLANDTSSTGKSKDAVKKGSNSQAKVLAKRKTKGPLTFAEIQGRIDAPVKTKIVSNGELSLRYGYVSQRGYYPDG
jgi:hypothetical protein